MLECSTVLAIEKGKIRGWEEKIHNNRTGFWPKGWAGLQMLSQTIRLSVFGLPSVANFSITFCCPPPCFFLSLLPSKGAIIVGAIIVAAISNNITIRGSSDGSLLQTYCRWTSYFHWLQQGLALVIMSTYPAQNCQDPKMLRIWLTCLD